MLTMEPNYYCYNPKCERTDDFQGDKCPECENELNKKYKGIDRRIDKLDDKVMIKVQENRISDAHPYYTLKILKANLLDSGIKLNSQDTIDKLNYKIKNNKIKAFELVEVFKHEFKKNINDNYGEQYFCIVTKFMEEEHKLENQTNKIRERYQQEFLSLLKSLNSLHEAGIVHGRISASNIFYDNQSWNIADIYPRTVSNLENEKFNDLKALAMTYKTLFEGYTNDPFKDSKNDKTSTIIDIIIMGRKIRTTKDGIIAIESELIFNLKQYIKFSYNLFNHFYELFKKISLTTKGITIALILLAILYTCTHEFVNGKNPVEAIKEILGIAQTNSPQKREKSKKNDALFVLAEEEFNADLKKIKNELEKHSLKEADIKTRELILKVFRDSGDSLKKNWAVDGKITFDFTNNAARKIGSNKDVQNNLISDQKPYLSAISQSQKDRIRVIDSLWFKGTQGKHGFYKQYTIYKTTPIDYNCSKNKDRTEREIAHVNATFARLGWGESKCENPELIRNEILKAMDSSGSWSDIRPNIINIFKYYGGKSDEQNIPDGYYPIVAGLVPLVRFPQFSQWCGYTERDLVQERE